MAEIVKEYSFSEIGLDDNHDTKIKEFESFQLSEIQEDRSIDPKVLDYERKSAVKNDFSIDDHVEKHRGIVENRIAEQRKKITDLVEREIKIIKKKTVAEAFEEGVELASKEVWEKESELIDTRLKRLDELVCKIESFRSEVLKEQEEKFLDLICSVTKWVTKKENFEPGYLSGLIKNTVLNEKNDQRIIFHYSRELSSQYQEELQKVKTHYEMNNHISFVENGELHEDDFEIELENKFIQVGVNAQIKMIDEIFDSLKESNGV